MLDLPKYGSENDIIIDVGEGGKNKMDTFIPNK